MKATKVLTRVTLAMALAMATMAGAATRYWSTGDGTWNDTPADPGNWDTANVVPVDEDSVVVNRADGATVSFESTNFDDTGENLVDLTLGGNGGASKLVVGTDGGDPAVPYVLQFSNALTIDDGGTLEVTGGQVADTGSGNRYVYINDGGSLKVTSGSLNLQTNTGIRLAWSTDHNASLEVSGTGKITAAAENGNNFYAYNGNSTLTIADSGELQFSKGIYVGTINFGAQYGGGTHDWTISGGILKSLYPQNSEAFFGNTSNNGTVSINQSGGIVTLGINRFRENATLNLSGGEWRPGNFYLDGGQVIQSGGTLSTGGVVAVDDSGTYTSEGGTVRLRYFTVADGQLSLDENTTLILNNAGTGKVITIGETSGSGTGTFEMKGFDTITADVTNWGAHAGVKVNQTGVIRGNGYFWGSWADIDMNGRVVADGYGNEETLRLNFGVTNTVDNTTDKGWYAVNGGKLLLPDITVAAGDSQRNWGEPDTDTTIDMINSLRMEFTDVGTSGPLTISLLAPDRSDVPTAPAALRGGPVIGVWDIADNGSFDFGGGSVDLTFRYDNSLYSLNKPNPL
ncbi:MAG: hypothetical protein K9N51_06105, partial [Candidatus Pacebacteria bacterium]|nr:hypothetical protein [Candidatus Paceibacterota bacterium]